MSDEPIGVECRFKVDGTIEVRRIFFRRQWVAVTQGRQWQDQLGRHVLVMLADNTLTEELWSGSPAVEIWLRPDTMTWALRPAGYDSGKRLV